MNIPKQNHAHDDEDTAATAAATQHIRQPSHKWIRRILLIMPTCILVTLGSGHEYLEQRLPWYHVKVPGEWIVILLFFIGTVTCGAVHEKLRHVAHGNMVPSNWIELIGDVLVYIVLQLWLVPCLVFIFICVQAIFYGLFNH